jgi:hypothetical protein
MSRGDRGVASRDFNLMEIRYDVTGGIDTFHRGALMRVNLKTTHLICLCAQGRCEVRSNIASERRIDDFEATAFAPDDRSNFAPASLDCAHRSGGLYARFGERNHDASSALGWPSTLSSVTSFE